MTSTHVTGPNAHLYLDESKCGGETEVAMVGGFLFKGDLAEPLRPERNMDGEWVIEWALHRRWAADVLCQAHATDRAQWGPGVTANGEASSANRCGAAERREISGELMKAFAQDPQLDPIPVVALTQVPAGSGDVVYRTPDLGLLALVSASPSLRGRAKVVVHAERRGSLGDASGLGDYIAGLSKALESTIQQGAKGPSFLPRRSKYLKRAAGADLLGLALADHFLYWLRGAIGDDDMPGESLSLAIQDLGFRQKPMVLWLPSDDPRGLAALIRVLRGDLQGLRWLDVVQCFDSRGFALLRDVGLRAPAASRICLLEDLLYDLRPFVERSDRAAAEGVPMAAVAELLSVLEPWTADDRGASPSALTDYRLLLGKALSHTGESKRGEEILAQLFADITHGGDRVATTPELMNGCVNALTSCAVAATDERRFDYAIELLERGQSWVDAYFSAFAKSSGAAAISGAHAQLLVLRNEAANAIALLDRQRAASPTLEAIVYPLSWRLVALARAPGRGVRSIPDVAKALAEATELSSMSSASSYLVWGASEVAVRWPELASPLVDAAWAAARQALDSDGVVQGYPNHLSILLLRNYGLWCHARGASDNAVEAFRQSLAVAPLKDVESVDDAVCRIHLRTLAYWAETMPGVGRRELDQVGGVLESALQGICGPREDIRAYSAIWLRCKGSGIWSEFLDAGGY